MRSAGPALWLLSLTWLLGGCAGLSSPTGETPRPAAHQAARQALADFDVIGKLGIWSDDRALTSRFRWRQRGPVTQARFNAPLGLGQWQVRESPADGASLQRGTEPAWRDRSLDRLVQRALELQTPVPISQLRYWLRGATGAGRAVTYDDAGRLHRLDYLDSTGSRWQMTILRYIAVDALELPALIVARGSATRTDGTSDTYRLRLVLDEWRLSDSTVALPATSSNDSPLPVTGPERLKIPGRR